MDCRLSWLAVIATLCLFFGLPLALYLFHTPSTFLLFILPFSWHPTKLRSSKFHQRVRRWDRNSRLPFSTQECHRPFWRPSRVDACDHAHAILLCEHAHDRDRAILPCAHVHDRDRVILLCAILPYAHGRDRALILPFCVRGHDHVLILPSCVRGHDHALIPLCERGRGRAHGIPFRLPSVLPCACGRENAHDLPLFWRVHDHAHEMHGNDLFLKEKYIYNERNERGQYFIPVRKEPKKFHYSLVLNFSESFSSIENQTPTSNPNKKPIIISKTKLFVKRTTIFFVPRIFVSVTIVSMSIMVVSIMVMIYD